MKDLESLLINSQHPSKHLPYISMESGVITSLQTSGSVGSRFVTQDELDDAKKAKEEEWKAAYERSVASTCDIYRYILPSKLIIDCFKNRLGQEPPPMPEEKEYDPRSLFEVRAFSNSLYSTPSCD